MSDFASKDKRDLINTFYPWVIHRRMSSVLLMSTDDAHRKEKHPVQTAPSHLFFMLAMGGCCGCVEADQIPQRTMWHSSSLWGLLNLFKSSLLGSYYRNLRDIRLTGVLFSQRHLITRQVSHPCSCLSDCTGQQGLTTTALVVGVHLCALQVKGIVWIFWWGIYP